MTIQELAALGMAEVFATDPQTGERYYRVTLTDNTSTDVETGEVRSEPDVTVIVCEHGELVESLPDALPAAFRP